MCLIYCTHLPACSSGWELANDLCRHEDGCEDDLGDTETKLVISIHLSYGRLFSSHVTPK